MIGNFDFLKSRRFWALVIGGLSVVAEGGFTFESWMRGIMVVVTGFVAVRTIDRGTETLAK